MPHRPSRLVGILGTHTEVGKTFVAARWLAHLRQQGIRVAARKPVQSYDVNDAATDADQLAGATGEASISVCPAHRRYPLAFAPPMAGDALARPSIRISELLNEIVWPAGIELGVVESVGGPRSPIAHDGDSIDLIARLQPDEVLLVADAKLGTLNAVRLCLQCIGSVPTVVFLNRFDAHNELHRLNRQWLQDKYGIATSIDVQSLPFA